MKPFVLRDLMLWLPEHNSPQPGWLRISDGRITHLGPDVPPQDIADPTISKGGAHALPGLVDAHRHFHLMSLIPKMHSGSSWRSESEALEEIEHQCLSTPLEKWVVFAFVDHSKWTIARPLKLKRLDSASRGRKVLLIDITLHRGMVSTAGLRESGIILDTHAFGEDVSRNGEAPTGLVWEAAFGRILNCVVTDLLRNLDAGERARLLREEADRALSQGLVAVHDPGLGIRAQGDLSELQPHTPLRINWSATSESGIFELPQDEQLSEFIPPQWGQKSVKIFLDGANRCAVCLPLGTVVRTAIKAGLSTLINLNAAPLRRSLENKIEIRDGHAHLPYLRFNNDAQLIERCRRFAEDGFSLKIHALGNEAAMQACRILEVVKPEHASVEHVIALYDREIPAVANTGAYVGIQTGFIPYYAQAIEEQGISNVMRVFPTRSLLEAGGKLVLSSDAPCGNDDPLHTLRRAVDRKKHIGTPLMAEEAVTPGQAIVAASTRAASSIGLEPHGLHEGSEAHLTLCNGNPFDVGTRVVETWVGGECVLR